VSDDANLVLDNRTGGRRIRPCRVRTCTGSKSTNPSGTSPRTKIVLISGNHNTEYSGNWALQGAVDFLPSLHDARAAELRDVAEVYVYPMVNPGRPVSLVRRGNPELTGMGYGDHNRVWDRTGISTIDAFTAAMKRDTAARRTTSSISTTMPGFNYLLTVASMTHSRFCQALTQREPTIRILTTRGSREWRGCGR